MAAYSNSGEKWAEEGKHLSQKVNKNLDVSAPSAGRRKFRATSRVPGTQQLHREF
jgi:hypothetical protein